MGKIWIYIIVLLIGVGCGVAGTLMLQESPKTVADPDIITPDYTITFLESKSEFDLEITSAKEGKYSLWIGGNQLSFTVDDSIGMVKCANYTSGGYKAKVTVFGLNGTDESQVSVHLEENADIPNHVPKIW